jgi:O-antigen ligase
MQAKIDLVWLSRIFWALVLISLPVTSFKYFPFLGKETMVRPLAFYPLAVLIVLLIIRLFRKSIQVKFSGSLVILGLFLVGAFTATAWGWAFAPIPMHGQEYIGRSLRAWATLAGGIAFFLTTILMNQTEDDLRKSIKWLYAGLLLSIVWGGIQMISYYTGFPERIDLNKIQEAFSIRKLLAKKRAAGFGFEPSWLANQIATIYLPWLFASVLSGYRVFRRKWIEVVLFLAAIVLLICTFSRGGILMAIASMILVFLLTQGRRMRSWAEWFIRPFRKDPEEYHARSLLLRTGIIIFVAGVIVSTGLILSSNKYFAQIWRSQKGTITDYAVDIYAGPRLAYAAAGWEVYLEHPVTGVGLGASGLYLYDHIPDWSVTTLSEITRQLTPNAWLYPNPKNLYIRLLSETGIVGFVLYLLFWMSILGIVIKLLMNDHPFSRYIGIGGLFTWFVLIFFNITQDSFIDPNQWLGLGIFLGLSTFFFAKSKITKVSISQE